MSGFIGPKPSDVPVGTVSSATVSANSIVVGGANGTTINSTSVTIGGSTLFGTSVIFGGFSRVSVFTANGTFTVPSNVTRLKAIVTGAGGSGGMYTSGNGGPGGGGGGTAIKYISGLTPGANIAIVIGIGGNSVATGAGIANGYNGGTTIFGTYCTATGGSGGVGSSVYSCSPGGVGSNGDININGQAGWGSGYMSGVANFGGDGGGTIFGGGGRGVPGGAVTGYSILQNGAVPGAGGGGGSTNYVSGTGANGIVIIEY